MTNSGGHDWRGFLVNSRCPLSGDDQKIKALFKEAIVEVMSENQELVSSLLVDALEDIGLSHAIEECENSESVSREEVFENFKN